jgi:hypothetical protein
MASVGGTQGCGPAMGRAAEAGRVDGGELAGANVCGAGDARDCGRGYVLSGITVGNSGEISTISEADRESNTIGEGAGKGAGKGVRADAALRSAPTRNAAVNAASGCARTGRAGRN